MQTRQQRKQIPPLVFFEEISVHVILQLKRLLPHYVRPILEYACSAWSPYTQVNINKLEMVQHRAARFIAMLAKLNLPSLAQRRVNTKLVTFHKIINQQIQIPNNDLNLVHTATRGHHRRYTRPLSRVDCHLSYTPFFHRIMEQFTPRHVHSY